MNHDAVIESTDISDAEVISRVLQGEKNLYAVIVRRYNQRLYRIGMSFLNDQLEVEDAMQVAYIHAYEGLSKFEFRASFSTWLSRILINEILLRKKKKRKNSLLVFDNTENRALLQVSTDSQTPANTMINTELKSILEEAISNLPEKYRTVFVMREMENMNVEETRECLAISDVNVKVRLNRAKAMLRKSLQHYYRNEDILHFHLSRCSRMVETVLNRIDPL